MYQNYHETADLNGIKIDLGIIDLIKKINAMGIKTYQSCQGGIIDDEMFPAYVIMDLSGFEKIEDLFPSNCRVEFGTGGYVLKDFHDNPPSDKDVIYIEWYTY